MTLYEEYELTTTNPSMDKYIKWLEKTVKRQEKIISKQEKKTRKVWILDMPDWRYVFSNKKDCKKAMEKIMKDNRSRGGVECLSNSMYFRIKNKLVEATSSYVQSANYLIENNLI